MYTRYKSQDQIRSDAVIVDERFKICLKVPTSGIFAINKARAN